MKNFLSYTKTFVILLLVTVILLGAYVFMLARPISYGMNYHTETVYEGFVFDGTMQFNSDGTMVNRNTNFAEELKSRYYYKGGYVFYTFSETDEEYEEEVAFINANFDEAVNTPFYSDKINAFKLVASEGDGYAAVYTCESAITFAVVGGVIELVLIALTAVSFVLSKKSKCRE